MPKRKKFSRAIEKAIYERDEHLCKICGRETQFDDGVLDHIIPLGKGGLDEATNLQWACHRCNLLKGDHYTSEEVRRILALPTDFNELLSLQKRERMVISLPQQRYEMKLPELSLDGLNASEVEKYIKILHETYQKETIIPEAFSTVVHEELSEKFVNIGFDHRLPREWFLPEQSVVFFNDPIFHQFGRTIAIAERGYLEEQIFINKEITHMTEGFSSESIMLAVEQMRDRGSEPDIFWPTIECWVDMHQWKEVYVQYSNVTPKPRLDSILKIGELKLKIIPPIGDIPKNPLLLRSEAITWHVRRYPEYGALYIALGNDRLYPMKYVECIARTTVRCEIKPKGILVLEEKGA